MRGWALDIGDLALRLVQTNEDRHKLTLPWEGPFIVAEVLRPCTYKLQTTNDDVFTNAGNIEQAMSFLPDLFEL